MTELFDPSGDFDQVVDGAETVTFRRGQSSSGTTVAGALRRRLTEREADASQGRVTAADVRWHLPTSALNEPPAPGDHIVDADAANWTVLEVRTETAGSRWLCLARNLAVVHGLFERIDIERATWTKDAAGAAKAAWHTQFAGLRARIQPRETQLRVDDGRQHALATHTIYLAEPVLVDQDQRVVGPGGRVYRIVDSRTAQQLGAPFVIDAVQVGHVDCGTPNSGEHGFAMSLEQAIHQRWATDANLCALLPATQLFTGTAPGDPPLPYAVLTRLGSTPVARTSSGIAVDDARMELAIWTADLESGQQIAIEADRRFERSAFALGEERVLVMRRGDRSERLEPDAVWRITLTYLVMHELPQPGIPSHV